MVRVAKLFLKDFTKIYSCSSSFRCDQVSQASWHALVVELFCSKRYSSTSLYFKRAFSWSSSFLFLKHYENIGKQLSSIIIFAYGNSAAKSLWSQPIYKPPFADASSATKTTVLEQIYSTPMGLRVKQGVGSNISSIAFCTGYINNYSLFLWHNTVKGDKM